MDNRLAEQVREALQRRLGDDWNVEEFDKITNNDKKVHGLSCRPEGGCVAPTLYIEDFEKALDGDPERIAWEMVKTVTKHMELDEYTTIQDRAKGILLSREEVLKRVVPRIISRSMNSERLEKLVSTDYLDLSVIYMVQVIENGAVTITKMLAEEIGVTAEELHEAALKNYRREKFVINRIADFTDMMLGGRSPEIPDAPMLVITTEDLRNGATAILIEDIFKDISEKSGVDLLIIPSSVHEVLVIPDCEEINSKEVGRWIKEVNRSVLEEEDILSDSLYSFKRETGKIAIAV